MKLIDIKNKADQINSLVNTDERPFKLFIDLYFNCKKHHLLNELSGVKIVLKLIFGKQHIQIQLTAFNLALELYKSTDNTYSYYITLCRLGILYSIFGYPFKAILRLRKSEIYFNEINDYDMTYLCLLNIGVMHHRIANYKDAETYYLKTIKLIEELNFNIIKTNLDKYNYNKYATYYNLCLVNTDIKNFKKALFYGEKTLEMAKEIGNSEYILKSIISILDAKIYHGDIEGVEEELNRIEQQKNLEKNVSYSSFFNTKYLLEHYRKNDTLALTYLRKSCEIIKELSSTYIASFKDKVNIGLKLSYEYGSLDDIIFFAKELQNIKKEQSQKAFEVSKLSLQQIANFTELEQEKKYTNEVTHILGYDLKAPIKRIKNIAEVLEKDIDKSDEYLPVLLDNATEALKLMDATLEYAQITSNIESFTQLSLHDIVNEIICNSSSKIESKSIQITHKDLPEIYGNNSYINKLFTILIRNAIKYGNKNNVIEIKSTNNNKFHTIEVIDKGYGIPKKDLKSIFKLFKKSSINNDTSSPGVGLAICKRIVNIHKGVIYAKSEIGKGSKFIIHLPID